ncbi:beta-ketoacyl-ACP synthase 3 [Bengtsoniella intestinalis]|uniref:beta-ketoacyl-ACP synthase 3 n=1 Tax=Bengtsoniella intestinalis TaxID=3073143 RepID=UPI00391F9909
MKGLQIHGLGHCAPHNVVTNHDFTKIIDTTEEWIVSRTGIETRHHATSETHTDLCVTAAKQALETAGIDPSQIGACIVATITPEYTVPAAACMVHKALSLPSNIPCFDINTACTGFLSGLHTMECLLQNSDKPYGLLIGAEVLSRIINFDDRSTCILFGDGAGAAIVGVHQGVASIGANLGCRGDDQVLTVGGVHAHQGAHIAMEGTAVFKFAVETVPACMSAVLQNTGATIDDVDFFVFHQANARIIDLAVKKYRIPADKYYKNIDRYGNTSAASIPMVLSELYQQGKVSSGSRVLCVGFGGGLTWGGALITFA